MQQHTILREEKLTGIALHSGGEVTVTLQPAEANSGIVFYRSDTGDTIPASSDAVGDTRLATTLKNDNDVTVGMVEHLLSSLAANNLDNIKIVLDGAEVPVLDGSSAPWLLFLNGCGRQEQQEKKRYIRVRKTVRVEDGDSYAEFSPAAEPSYHVRIDYAHKYVNSTGMQYDFTLTPEGYSNEIARARTFCYVNDVEFMHKSKRALGGTLQNAVVYHDSGVINDEGLRYPNEFVRHKVLDAIGDCYISGYLVIARYTANKPGHGINNRLMRMLMNDDSAWEWHSA